MKHTIRLRESELKRIISESVKKVLNEIERSHPNDIPPGDEDIYYHGDINPDVWDALQRGDYGERDINSDIEALRTLRDRQRTETDGLDGKVYEAFQGGEYWGDDNHGDSWLNNNHKHTYNIKHTIRLTESELKNMIAKSVRRVLNENLDDDMVIWDKRGKDEFALILKKIDKKVSNLFGGEENEYGFKDTPLSWIIAEYSLDGNRKRTAKKVYSILNNYDMLHNGDKILDSLVKKMLILGQQ